MIGKINIFGDIGTYDDVKGVELIDVISQVRKQPDATSFEVHINSEGGVVDTGYDIFNYLKSLGLPVTTIGNGIVASSATVIFMAGSQRETSPGTRFMIHLPMGGISFATAEEMELHSKTMRQTENKFIDFYSKELGLSKEAVTPLLKNETWLTESQLLDLGFVTSKSKLKIAAKASVKSKSKSIKMSKKTNKFQAILNAMRGTTVAKLVKTADQGDLVFPGIEEDSEVIELGASATLDGQPVGGTEDEPKRVVAADGVVYLFVDSKLSEKIIDEDEIEDIDTTVVLDALEATLEVAAEMEQRVTALETETVAIKAERNQFEEKLKQANKAIAKLKGTSNQPDEDPKDTKAPEKTTSNAVANWRKSKQAKNKK